MHFTVAPDLPPWPSCLRGRSGAARERRSRTGASCVIALALTAAATGATPRALQSSPASGSDSWELSRDTRPLVAVVRPDGTAYARGEWLVGLADPAATLDVVRAAELLGGRLVGEVPRLALLALDGPDDDERFGEQLAARADVAWVERNGLGEGGGDPPGDTFFSGQWHLSNTGQTGGTPGADVGALAAWDLELGDPGVTLALLDTGIDFTHPEFAGRTRGGHDFVNEDADPTADHPHGVQVAGLAAANTDNALGVAGIDRRCTLVAVKVLDQFNGGTVLDLVQGLDYCAQQGVDVVSMSLINYPGSPAIEAALLAARQADCILLACAGNFGIGNADVSWPGASAQTLSIGATTHEDLRAGFSGTGNALDFVAPGSAVSTVLFGGGEGFELFSGCSAATPVAAGIVSLLAARYPGIDQACVEELLRAGAADEVGHPAEDTLGWDPFHGWGRLNAHDTLAAFTPCTGQAVLTGTPATAEIDGDVQDLVLEAGAAHAGQIYFVLGSATGTSPALSLGGFQLPLVFDGYGLYTLGSPNGALLPSSLGFLDAAGSASTPFVVFPGTTPSLIGRTLYHAALVLDLSLVVTNASTAAPVLLVDTTELFADDFEAGGPGWTFDVQTGQLWHVTVPNECGVPTRALAFRDGPLGCTYATTPINMGRATSPALTLTGMPPYRVSFDAVLDFDTTGPGMDSARLTLLDTQSADQVELWNATGLAAGTIVQGFELEVPDGTTWSGRTVKLQLYFGRGTGGDTGAGFSVDELRLTASSP